MSIIYDNISNKLNSIKIQYEQSHGLENLNQKKIIYNHIISYLKFSIKLMDYNNQLNSENYTLEKYNKLINKLKIIHYNLTHIISNLNSTNKLYNQNIQLKQENLKELEADISKNIKRIKRRR